MAFFDPQSRELTVKVVYYGPGLSGKTSNLKYIYENLEEPGRGQLVELAGDSDRTLFFDFLPLEIGQVKGVKVRLQLYTVPGQVFHEATRRRVLQGADGVVFVADSQRRMREANLQSLRQLEEHLAAAGADLEDIPMVLQYNKRDLKEVSSLEEMDRDLNPANRPFFEAIATEGVGVEDTFKAASALVLRKLLSAPAESYPPPPGKREEVPAAVGEELFPVSAELLDAETGPSLELPESVEDSADLLFAEEAQSPLGEAPAGEPSEEPGREGPLAAGEAVLLEEAPEEAPAPAGEESPLHAATPEAGPLSGGIAASAPPVKAHEEALSLSPGRSLRLPLEIEGRRFTLVICLEVAER